MYCSSKTLEDASLHEYHARHALPSPPFPVEKTNQINNDRTCSDPVSTPCKANATATVDHGNFSSSSSASVRRSPRLHPDLFDFDSNVGIGSNGFHDALPMAALVALNNGQGTPFGMLDASGTDGKILDNNSSVRDISIGRGVSGSLGDRGNTGEGEGGENGAEANLSAFEPRVLGDASEGFEGGIVLSLSPSNGLRRQPRLHKGFLVDAFAVGESGACTTGEPGLVRDCTGVAQNCGGGVSRGGVVGGSCFTGRGGDSTRGGFSTSEIDLELSQTGVPPPPKKKVCGPKSSGKLRLLDGGKGKRKESVSRTKATIGIGNRISNSSNRSNSNSVSVGVSSGGGVEYDGQRAGSQREKSILGNSNANGKKRRHHATTGISTCHPGHLNNSYCSHCSSSSGGAGNVKTTLADSSSLSASTPCSSSSRFKTSHNCTSTATSTTTPTIATTKVISPDPVNGKRNTKSVPSSIGGMGLELGFAAFHCGISTLPPALNTTGILSPRRCSPRLSNTNVSPRKTAMMAAVTAGGRKEGETSCPTVTGGGLSPLARSIEIYAPTFGGCGSAVGRLRSPRINGDVHQSLLRVTVDPDQGLASNSSLVTKEDDCDSRGGIDVEIGGSGQLESHHRHHPESVLQAGVSAPSLPGRRSPRRKSSGLPSLPAGIGDGKVRAIPCRGLLRTFFDMLEHHLNRTKSPQRRRERSLARFLAEYVALMVLLRRWTMNRVKRFFVPARKTSPVSNHSFFAPQSAGV